MKRIFVLLFALIAGNYVFAQSLPSKCEVFLPNELNKSIIYKSAADKLSANNYGQNGSSTGRFWDVYSDRCDNVVYNGPNKSSGTTGKSLAFNQKVRIAKIENGFAWVYIENKPGAVNYPQLSSDCKAVGWVPMDNLLLWSSCPTNDVGIYRKALIVNNLNNFNEDKSIKKISHHPDVENTSHVKVVEASIDVHYVMKEIGNRYLIANYSKLSGTLTDQVLEGWVSDNSFIFWNQRSCLEPNWDNDDVEYFKSRKEEACLYGNAELTKIAQQWVFGRKNDVGQEATQYRMEPRSMRFPLLDREDDREDRFKITAFGSPDGELGQQSVDQHESKSIQDELLNERSHINVIVVIDGTKSMGKYFNAMSDAVRKATDYLGQAGQVEVGVVIYRDHTDGKDNVIEFQKMSKPNDASLQSFLKDIGRNGYGANSSSTDRTNHEALYLGLKTALDHKTMGYDTRNSNLIFVIGDCGNDPSDKTVSKDELLNMCKEVNAQLFSFQVLNQDKPAWDDFNTQLTELFIEHMKNMYTSLNAGVKVSWRPVKNGLGVRSNAEEHLFVSEIHRGQPGVELSEGELTSLIQESYKVARDAVEEQKKAIIEHGPSHLMATKGDKDMKTISIGEDYFRSMVPPETWEQIKKTNALFAYTGYAKKDDGLGHDYWKPIVYLSSEELLELIKKLEPLKIAVKVTSYGTKERNDYVKAVAGIIQSMTERNSEEIEHLTTDSITRIIGGLNASTPMLKGKQSDKVYTLSDIKNINACSDQEFQKILKRMERKIDDLSNLPKGTHFKYSFEQNNSKSYWVPLEMIP